MSLVGLLDDLQHDRDGRDRGRDRDRGLYVVVAVLVILWVAGIFGYRPGNVRIQ